MAEPYNIIVAPFEVWTAPVGTAAPEVNAAPAGGWVVLGTNQSLEYNEDGVAVTHEQTIDFHRFLGSTGPRKASRSEEGLTIELTLHDMTLEQYALALGTTLATTAPGAGQIGEKSIGLYRGLSVPTMALLVRGPSPYDDTEYMQWHVPVVVIDGEPEVVGSKDEPAGLEFTFTALEDPDAATAAERFGSLTAYTAPATP